MEEVKTCGNCARLEMEHGILSYNMRTQNIEVSAPCYLDKVVRFASTLSCSQHVSFPVIGNKLSNEG